MTETSAPATAHDMVAMLRRHYLPEGRPAGGVLAVEIGSPDGRRRADALWCPTTISRDSGLVGHEIKVSRADVMAELADPTKCDPWFRYCSRWWLTVADPTLVEGLDVPETWGICSPPSGRRTRSFTVIRPAPLLKPGDTGDAWRRILAWYSHRREQDVARLESDLRFSKQNLGRAHVTIEDLRRSGAGMSAIEKRTRDIIDAVHVRVTELNCRRYGSDVKYGETVCVFESDVTPDVIAEAVVDLLATRAVARDARRELDGLVMAAKRLADPMVGISKQLASLAEQVPAEISPTPPHFEAE